MLKNQRLSHFGSFSLELDPPTLRRGLEVLKLPQRQMEILCLLIAAHGSPVPKAAFFEQVWSGSFVEEGNLTQTIFLLRRTLGKLPDGGGYIETLPRLGYRIAPAAFTQHGLGQPPQERVDPVPIRAKVVPSSAPALDASTSLREPVVLSALSRWEPLLWIGLGIVVSLFAMAVSFLALAYVHLTK
jgi:DNA-binding winged helix-turn-helix (wHTH) protein